MGAHSNPIGPPPPGTNWEPQPKVAAGGIGGAAAIVVVWLASTVGIDMPETVATALGALITTGAAYFTPHRGAE